MRVTPRDDAIIAAIHDVGDGVLARRHIRSQFFSHATTLRALQKVMARLAKHRFIRRTTVYYHQLTQPRIESIYWLDYQGILQIAQQLGVEEIYYPENEGENQMRRLERNMRRQGIRWLREPLSTDKLGHNFSVVDFRMKVAQDVASLPAVEMEWVNESVFRSTPVDRVTFTIRDQAGQVVERERGVCPDGFCLIRGGNRRQNDRWHQLHLLIEMDMGTHPVKSRFATDKAAPYAAYIGSGGYKARFGTDMGDWLVITTGKRRMHHLIHHTQEKVGEGARWFLFSTWQQVMDPEANVLTAPIWLRPRIRQEPKPWALLVDKV